MARYRKIDPRIWNDEKFRTMSHESQRLFLFVLTHPALTMIGAMRATRSGLSEELGLDAKAFREAFGEALSKGMLKYDEKAFLLWLPNFLKYNAPESPNVVKSWDSALDLLPECDLRNEVLRSANAFVSTMSKAFSEALPKAFSKAFPKAMPKTMPNQEQEQEQKQNKYISQSSATASDASEDVSRSDLNPQKPDDVTTVKWKRYLKLRKQKNLPLTVDALELLKREAGKAGKTISEVIDFCLENSYAGFKASWESTSAPAGEARPNNAPPAFGKISGKQASFFGAKLAEMLGDRLPMQYRRGAKSWDEVGQRCADAMVQNEGEWNSYWLPALVKVGLVKGATA